MWYVVTGVVVWSLMVGEDRVVEVADATIREAFTVGRGFGHGVVWLVRRICR